MSKQIRTFIAIELPPPIRRALAQLQEQLKRDRPPVRWVTPDKIHLTLKFLGEITPEQVRAVGEATAGVAAEIRPFTLEATGIGVFPNPRRPRVVWVGVKGEAEPLKQLHAHLETALAGLGFPPESRPFSPHLTLGRTHRRAKPGEVRPLGQRITSMEIGSLGRWHVDEIIVMRSDLRREGPLYTPQRTVSLQG
jgi:2'-5' RNA ligase